jgi:hypothetical protein
MALPLCPDNEWSVGREEMAEIMSESSDKATNYYYFFFAISFSSNCRKRETQFSSAEYHIRSITLELILNVFLSLPTSGGESKGGQTT